MKKRYCINCGKEIIPGAKFCVNCGSKNITDNINNISKDSKPQASIDPFDDISEDDFFSSDNEFDIDESIFSRILRQHLLINSRQLLLITCLMKEL